MHFSFGQCPVLIALGDHRFVSIVTVWLDSATIVPGFFLEWPSSFVLIRVRSRRKIVKSSLGNLSASSALGRASAFDHILNSVSVFRFLFPSRYLAHDQIPVRRGYSYWLLRRSVERIGCLLNLCFLFQ